VTSLAFLLIVVLLAVAIITGAEIFDRRQSALRRQIIRDEIMVRGVVRRVEKSGLLDARSYFPWRIDVDFEYEGQSYSLEQRCRSMPLLHKGDHVTVYVYRKDPWKSVFIA